MGGVRRKAPQNRRIEKFRGFPGTAATAALRPPQLGIRLIRQLLECAAVATAATAAEPPQGVIADGVDGAPNGIKRAKMVVVESAIWKGAVRGQVYHRYLVCHARRA